MLDDERPTGRGIIEPSQPPKYEVIPPARPSIPLMSASEAPDSGPLRLYRDSNQDSRLSSFEKSKARPFDIEFTSIFGKNFSLEKSPDSCSRSPDLTGISGFLTSIPPDILDALFACLIRFLAFIGNAGQNPHRSSISADSPFKEALELILKAQGLGHPSENTNNGQGFQKNVQTVWKAIIGLRCDIFQKVELTKALQKKLKAQEINDVLEFLISEGGVLGKVEQNKIGSTGRDPSPKYRLLRLNPKYGTDI